MEVKSLQSLCKEQRASSISILLKLSYVAAQDENRARGLAKKDYIKMLREDTGRPVARINLRGVRDLKKWTFFGPNPPTKTSLLAHL